MAKKIMILFILVIFLVKFQPTGAKSSKFPTDRTGIPTDRTGIPTDRTGIQTDRTGFRTESTGYPTERTNSEIRSTRHVSLPTSAPSCNYPCAHKKDGDYPDPTNPCTAHFYVCDNGRCYNYYCHNPLVYDPKLDECVYPSEWAGCSLSTGAGGSTASRVIRSTTTGRTPPACNFNCANKPDGDYADPYDSCTAHYYVCANSQCFNFYCHDPLVYDPDNDECVYRDDWSGCQGSTYFTEPPFSSTPERPFSST